MSTATLQQIDTSSPRGGPRTEEGKAASSQNAITHGLFTNRDFIRPGEEIAYSKLSTNRSALKFAPAKVRSNSISSKKSAVRCGVSAAAAEVESHLAIGLDDGRGYIFDPMETANPAAEKVQKSVDRSRAQAHRLLHKCTTELHKLQIARSQSAPRKATPSSFCKTGIHPVSTLPQTPRNAECPCGSGLKHKRCCGKEAPAVLHAV